MGVHDWGPSPACPSVSSNYRQPNGPRAELAHLNVTLTVDKQLTSVVTCESWPGGQSGCIPLPLSIQVGITSKHRSARFGPMAKLFEYFRPYPRAAYPTFRTVFRQYRVRQTLAPLGHTAIITRKRASAQCTFHPPPGCRLETTDSRARTATIVGNTIQVTIRRERAKARSLRA
jgi:hypothetical protein